MAHPEAPVQVLKITGLGRSGSTILDVVLGNHPKIESVGEVGNLMRNGWISHKSLRGIPEKSLRVPLCTCGKRLDVLYVDAPEKACPFWSRVRREWVERVDPRDDIEGYPKLQNDFELERRWSRYGLDPLPRLLYQRRGPSARFRSYARLTRAFYESIRAASGKPVIVDSAKSPMRTFALSMVPGIDLYAVHLVRNGRGIITSLRKTLKKDVQAGIMWDHEGRPMWKTAVRWTVLNLASEWVCARLGPGRAMRLRYEDFVADPEAALGEDRLPDRARPGGRGGRRLLGRTPAGRAQHRRQQDQEVGLPDAAAGRPGVGGYPLPRGAAPGVGAAGVAHAPVWIR
jgi:hypothetical protein